MRPISGKKVRVEALGQAPQEFDAVVLATHSDQALKLLGSSAKQASPSAALHVRMHKHQGPHS